MTNPTYARLAATARKLITKYGGPGKLYKLSQVENSSPWEAKESSTVPSSDIIACVLPAENISQSDNTRKDTATIYIAGDKSLQINTRDFLEFNGVNYYFSQITHYIPDGQNSVVYIITGGER